MKQYMMKFIWDFFMGSLLPGRVFGLKMILYGTSDDPLQSNMHVDRKIKREVTCNIVEREKGECI